ncbi:MAG: hypothetical protein AAF708_22505 [Deinococcota bacterium]
MRYRLFFVVLLGFLISCSGDEGSPPIIMSFNASPESITEGQSSELTWDISGDAPITLSLTPDTDLVDGVDLVSPLTVSPTETTTYTLTATNTSGSDSQTVTVTVLPDDSTPPAAPTIDSFAASVSEQTATFTWSLTAEGAVN